MAVTTYRDLVLTFLVKLVLEVFGGGGAIWGFSEACGLRTTHTIWFWRPVALTVAFLFAVRWILQIIQQTTMVMEETKTKRSTTMSTETTTTELSRSSNNYQDVVFARQGEDTSFLKSTE
jgi:hypothetical protein